MNDFQTKRRSLLAAGGGLLLTGCEGLDFSAAGEGTGVQVIGAVVVLARYRATAQQKAVAQKRTREMIMAAAKPEYEKRRAAIGKDSQKKIATIEREHAKHPAGGASRGGSPAAAPPGAGIPLTAGASSIGSQAQPQVGSAFAIQQRRKQEEIARVKAEADARIASLNTAMRSMGGTVDHSVKPSDPDPTTARIAQLASLDDRNALLAALTADVPRYIAVPVPSQGIEAEKSGKALVVVMDTRTQHPASDDVLVLDRQPAIGKDIKVDGVTARVVGN